MNRINEKTLAALTAACLALAAALGALGAAIYLRAPAETDRTGEALLRFAAARRFSGGKTASGKEIAQEEPTPEELSAEWDPNVPLNEKKQLGIWYKTEEKDVMNEALGYEIFEKSEVACMRGEEELWRAEIRDFWVQGCEKTAAGTVIWGETPFAVSARYAWLALFDDSGAPQWKKRLEHGGNETVAAVAENPDGTLAAFSRCDRGDLCFALFDRDGNELRSRKTEIGNRWIRNAVRFQEGYLAQVQNEAEGVTARLIRLDAEGAVLGEFNYEAEDCVYHLADLAEYGGKLYLSAYAVPPRRDEGGRHEIADVLDYVFAEEKGEFASEELTPIVRRNYTAVLLICDAASGAPETFYSVPGSLGGALNTNDRGEMEWEVQSITSSFFSPATSSFTIGGLCRIFRYSFGVNGALVQKTETEETVPYRR